MILKRNVSNLIEKVDLRSEPVIITVNEFNEEAAKNFNRLMSIAHNTGQKVIPVIISSFGGEVMSLMKMADIIKASEIPVATIIEGKAMSCGAALFTFGTEGLRFMAPNATLMIHDISGGCFGKKDDVKVKADFMADLNKKVYTIMARNCGLHDNYFLDMIHENSHADLYMDAKEAKKHKLVDQIRIPKIKIDINVEINLE